MLAVLFMPLSMAPAAPAAHAMQGAMAMQHCPQPASSDKAKGAMGECTMACASALPAVDFARVEPSILPEQPAPVAVECWLDGIHPETATPPPKLA
jgi:hypothetical protein